MGGMTSSTSTSMPKMPGYVKGLYKDVYKDVNGAYNKWSRKGMPVYSKPTFAELTDPQMSALNKMTDLASANSGQKGMGGHLQSILDNGGFNSGQLQTMGSMRQMADNPFMNSLINGNGLTDDQRLVADKYRTGMNEQFGTDAAYNRVKQDALDSSAQSVTAQAARMGRLGGGANQNILARAQGSLAANMDTAEMDKWRARTQAAAGNLANLSGVGVSQQGTAMDRKAGIESSLFNMNQAGLDNMGRAYETALQPSKTLMGAGNVLQQEVQNVINDDMRIWDAKHNPMSMYQQILQLASGMPTGTTQTAQQSPFQTATGIGLLASAFL